MKEEGDQGASEASIVGPFCLFAQVVLACWLELELARLPAVREMEQLVVEEALAECKLGRAKNKWAQKECFLGEKCRFQWFF